MSDQFGIHVRRQHRAAIEPLSRAVAQVQQQSDFHDAGAPRGAVGLANALRDLCCACKAFLADPVMAELLPENETAERKLGGMFAMSRLQETSARPGGTARRSPVVVLSRAEGEARFQEMYRANEARMNGRAAASGVSGGDKLKAAMTKDFEAPATSGAANPGVAVLNRAMGVRS